MAATVVETPNTLRTRYSLREGASTVREFQLTALDESATYSDVPSALAHPSIPQAGDTYTLPDGQVLIAQEAFGEKITDSGDMYLITVPYSLPRGTLILLPRTVIRAEVRGGSSTHRTAYDLDDKMIGNPVYVEPGGTVPQPVPFPSGGAWQDPDADIGADVEVPEWLLVLHMPEPAHGLQYMPVFTAMAQTVNSEEFYGLAPGECRYLNPDFLETGPNAGEGILTHTFKIAHPIHRERFGEPEFLPMDLIATSFREYDVAPGRLSPPREWNPTGAIPANVQFPKRRLYRRADHNLLLTAY